MDRSNKLLNPGRMTGSPGEPHEGGASEANDVNGQGHQAPGAGKKGEPSMRLPQDWDRVRGLALKHLDRCLSLEPKVLQDGNPGAIHDIRVASRRLQQVLDLMFPAPQARGISRLRRRLKRCRRALSEVRNCDVLLERVHSTLARKRTARREAWRAIRDSLNGRRAASFEKALRKISKANLPELYIDLKECLAESAESCTTAEDASHSASLQVAGLQRLDARLIENLKKVWQAVQDQAAQSSRRPDPDVIHLMRIQIKHMRYLVEVIHSFGLPETAEVLVWLRSIQKHLGYWHDLIVFEQMAIEAIADRDFLGSRMELAMEIERLILKNRATKKKAEEKCLAMISDQASFARAQSWVNKIAALPDAGPAGG